MMEAAPVTVLVCTRNRPLSLKDTVRGILESDYPDFELHVIDQSTDDMSELALREWRDHPRLRYTRTGSRGLASARNLGFSTARPGIVAMTDDDCRVPRDWLRKMVTAFSAGDRVAIVLGNVLRAEHDSSTGFILGYTRTTPFLATGIRDKPQVEGMGACMAIRTEAWSALSGFDTMLGAGSRFPSSDETDFIIRALLSGYQAYETPDVSVVHYGFRPLNKANELIHGYLQGIGAMLTKHVKCGDWPVLYVYGALAMRWMFSHPIVEYGFRPSRWVRLRGFLQGSMQAATVPVNRKTRLFDPA
jgi:glycosyltransferase involved in cell wall biosynthesis